VGRLWGIDQEFIGSFPLLGDLLIGRTRDAAARRKLAEWRDRDLVSLPAGKFEEAVMTATDLATFADLRPAFVADREGSRILDDLIDSARVYQFNSTERYAENNGERSLLMQGYFLEQYRAVKGARPRVLLKLGLHHAGRGTSPTAIYDIGSLLPGLAAANGKRSLHIAFIPLAGKVRAIAPAAQGFTTIRDYKEDAAAKLLATAGIAGDSVPEHGLVLIPLEPVRYRLTGKQLREMGAISRFT